MKKYTHIIIYSLVLAVFVGCNGNTNRGKDVICNGNITVSTYEYQEAFSLNEHASDSPALKFDISLSLVELSDTTVANNINRAIAYTMFESHSSSVKEACKEFVARRKAEYKELLPEYINSKNNEIPAFWFNNYYNINSEVEKGYKGYLNYIITWEEFTGGAHPSNYYTVLNFNPKTGEEVVLSDILKSDYEEPLTNILVKNLAKQLQVDDINGIKEKGYLYPDTEMFVSNNFILGNNNITFIYNIYEIAPYAFGDVMIDVTYNELKELMK